MCFQPFAVLVLHGHNAYFLPSGERITTGPGSLVSGIALRQEIPGKPESISAARHRRSHIGLRQKRSKMTVFPWNHYSRLQAELDNPNISDRSWGVEAAMSRILAGEFTDPLTINDDLDRAIASEQRRERHRAALRRRHLMIVESGPHPEQHLVARAELRAAEGKMTPPKWRLLVAVAEGYDYTDLAAAEGATLGALRARVFRLRREVA
jgi:hypothetical protein